MVVVRLLALAVLVVVVMDVVVVVVVIVIVVQGCAKTQNGQMAPGVSNLRQNFKPGPRRIKAGPDWTRKTETLTDLN